MNANAQRQKMKIGACLTAFTTWVGLVALSGVIAMGISSSPVFAQVSLAGAAPDELTFRDFFTQPVGPRGLEPTTRLLALHGHTVRLRGFAAHWTDPPAGLVLLAPVPVQLGDEDESFADDLPAATVYVHLSDQAVVDVPAHRGQIALVGQLDVGPKSEADGRVSFVRLLLDARATQAVIHHFQLASETSHAP